MFLFGCLVSRPDFDAPCEKPDSVEKNHATHVQVQHLVEYLSVVGIDCFKQVLRLLVLLVLLILPEEESFQSLDLFSDDGFQSLHAVA